MEATMGGSLGEQRDPTALTLRVMACRRQAVRPAADRGAPTGAGVSPQSRSHRCRRHAPRPSRRSAPALALPTFVKLHQEPVRVAEKHHTEMALGVAERVGWSTGLRAMRQQAVRHGLHVGDGKRHVTDPDLIEYDRRTTDRVASVSPVLCPLPSGLPRKQPTVPGVSWGRRYGSRGSPPAGPGLRRPGCRCPPRRA